jgi:hypothetical protein
MGSACNIHGRSNQWLCINLVVHRIPEQQAELVYVYVRRYQCSLAQVLSGPRGVIVLSYDVNLAQRYLSRWKNQAKNYYRRQHSQPFIHSATPLLVCRAQVLPDDPAELRTRDDVKRMVSTELLPLEAKRVR